MGKLGPQWLETAVFYEIYPQSFYDTNGDGIGDLPGIIAKLDYLEYMGFNAVWINPCFVSPFQDAGYDVSDYYQIAPRYGTNDDLKRLCSEAAKRGIRILIDFVPGHTSIEHPWFKESCKPETNDYTNWYVWNDYSLRRTDGDMYFVSGHSDRNGSYMPNFFYFQPALNYGFAKPDPTRPWQLATDHPDVLAVREEMKNVMRFWLDLGVSGFRVDMAGSLVKNDADQKATSAFWRNVRDMFDREYPEAVLVSEWFYPERAIPAGFHMDFLWHKTVAQMTRGEFRRLRADFEMSKSEAKSFFRKDDQGSIDAFLEAYIAQYEKTRKKGYISLFSGNHDLERISANRDVEDLEIFFTFLLTMPGVPFIYYGDEIGMRYMEELHSKEGGYYRTGARTPMQWTSGHNAGFSTGIESDLYLPVDNREGAPSVECQIKRPDSLLECVRQLVALRKEHPALSARGDFEPLCIGQSKCPLVYLRTKGSETILVALNPSCKPVKVSLAVPARETGFTVLAGQGATLSTKAGEVQLEMDGASCGVFLLDGAHG